MFHSPPMFHQTRPFRRLVMFGMFPQSGGAAACFLNRRRSQKRLENLTAAKTAEGRGPARMFLAGLISFRRPRRAAPVRHVQRPFFSRLSGADWGMSYCRRRSVEKGLLPEAGYALVGLP